MLQSARTVRLARRADLPALARIWRELMRLHEATDGRFALAPAAVERWLHLAEDMLGREDGFLLVAEERGVQLGFCVGWIARNPPIYKSPEVGFISEIAVTAGAQRRGVGRALVREAAQWFSRQGLHEMQLSTAVWNEGAQKFWRALGGEPLLVRYAFDLTTLTKEQA
ncbi:MAG: GNAT family N-acetyltransferase [Deltaproteobacteria bacterium]|nr:GNAT family N-acetyltransferase [Deltaproteobacteria bacterium]